jgi:hypothetical protein
LNLFANQSLDRSLADEIIELRRHTMMTEFVHCTPIRSGPEFLEALKKAAAAQASDAARLAYEQLAPSMGGEKKVSGPRR